MSTAVRRAIYNKLAVDAANTGGTALGGMLGTAAPNYTYGIYHDAAPDHATPPYIIFSKSSGIPTAEGFFDPLKPVPAAALETDVWLIKAVDRNTTADTAEKISARITTLLNDAAPTISGGGTILYLRRESDVEYPEPSSGDLFRNVGALYRVVSPTI